MRINLGEDEQPEIGLIALIDCIFFLLMFFMVATSFRQQVGEKPQKELPVILPAAQMSLDRASSAPPPLTIGVDKQGKLYVDGSRVSVQGLHERLQQEAASYPGRPIRIDGDEMTRYQDIVHVLDLCQFEGFTKISMHTRQ
jgi:biopolymer transport protein ExbD